MMTNNQNDPTLRLRLNIVFKFWIGKMQIIVFIPWKGKGFFGRKEKQILVLIPWNGTHPYWRQSATRCAGGRKVEQTHLDGAACRSSLSNTFNFFFSFDLLFTKKILMIFKVEQTHSDGAACTG